MKIKKIISGGQTGADMGGLLAGKKLKIETGGMAPRGWKTEAGKNLDLKNVFDLEESYRDDYSVRTKDNVKRSDGTVIFMEKISVGSNLTIRLCKELRKPFLVCPSKKEFVGWLKDNEIKILNVAGNRESVSPGISERVKTFLVDSLKQS